ncbi:MAG: transcriptional repressor [Anaerolineae bacterium]|nr:transcriptional repressor [Anaerolineae bacterium]
MNTTQTEMALVLRQGGYRLTQPRLAVLQVLEKNDEGLNPEAIYQQGKTICPSLGLVTVYRTLDLLTELGLVRRVHSGHRCHSYACAGSDRHHLICQACHRVIEFPCNGLDGLIESVRRRTGYTITEHLLELSGLCPECQDGKSTSGSAGSHSSCAHTD